METKRRTISHKRKEEDQIRGVVKEDQAKKDLEAIIKLFLKALFVRRTTMTVVIVDLDNVLARRIQITW